MTKLMTKIDYDKVGYDSEQEFMKAGGTLPNGITWEQLEEMLYFILMDKTEGEAFQKVRAIHAGRGIEAYQKIYKWYSATTGMGLMERTKIVMNPTAPKREEDMASALDMWLERVKELRRYGAAYDLNVAFKVAAVKSLMVGRAKDMFDQWEEMISGGGEIASEKQWDSLISKVTEYAARRRLETNMNKEAMA